jgi:hypothetical protein
MRLACVGGRPSPAAMLVTTTCDANTLKMKTPTTAAKNAVRSGVIPGLGMTVELMTNLSLRTGPYPGRRDDFV